MTIRLRFACGAATVLALYSFGSATFVHAAPSLIEFDARGCTNTRAFAINRRNDVTGFCFGQNQWHGFIRTHNGKSINFDPAGSVSTTGLGINRAASVVGSYDDRTTTHAFLRTVDGGITIIDPPGATSARALAINDDGLIAGQYVDSIYAGHAFLRGTDGSIASFNIPGCNIVPVSINRRGVATGDCDDYTNHGFVRSKNGKLAKFDVDGASATIATSIDDANTITGQYLDQARNSHGFLRAPDGTISTFDAAGFSSTVPTGIALTRRVAGTSTYVAGYASGQDGNMVGFLRDASGMMTLFNAPDAGSGQYQGTFSQAINDRGSIAGYYIDSSGDHAFLRIDTP